MIQCTASVEEPNEIMKIHHLSRHPGIRRTCYFMSVSTSTVRGIVKWCQTCQSIDPAPVKWWRGKLGVSSTWNKLTMDITHYGGQHFLTLINCRPSRFAGLFECYLPIRVGVLWTRATRGDPYWQRHHLLQQTIQLCLGWMEDPA